MSENDNNPALFSGDNDIGSFKGFAERGFEFAADLVIPYKRQEISQPQFGQFVLVELSDADEAALGRITKWVPAGLLSSAEGEDYVEKMRARKEPVPEDLKTRKLKYRVQVKLLGAVRRDPFRFAPSQRRMPHLGARVAWPSSAVLKKLCGLGCRPGDEKIDLGNFALGEFIYSGESGSDGDCVHLKPRLPVGFNIRSLVARRTAVFARAGYGKSNLMKLLVSELYRGKTPMTDDGPERPGRPVGTLIFDADGEYFWPDKKDRPGLCNVRELRDKITVYTNRESKGVYGDWKAGPVRLDLRELEPRDVFSIMLPAYRQEQQNVQKLKLVRRENWPALLDLMRDKGLSADDEEIGALLGYGPDQIKSVGVEVAAARSNLFNITRLHDPNSVMVQETLKALGEGGVVVVDLSLLSAKAGEMTAGLLMRKIFSHNQANFTGDGESPLPVIAVIEEAQRVLGERMDETSPFVEWVKEGRKYDLGAVLVTQQPGALSSQLLSQVDNWFCFHVLSQGDALTLGRYNSHFSEDILAHMVAESMKGNCFMWSAPDQPFVLPVRIRNFEAEHKSDPPPDPPSVSRRVEGEKAAKEKSDDVRDTAEKLARRIREKGDAVHLPEFESGKELGIGSGQLFRLIREVAAHIPQGEVDARKMPLMRQMLGDGVPVIKREGKKKGGGPDDFYCAPKEAWDQVLAPAAGK